MHIVNLQLAAPDLATQYEFYTRVFQFPVLSATPGKIEFQVGASQLTLLHSSLPSMGAYHFALNIPENQFAEATQWLRQYVALISDEAGTETFYASDWDAHMAYFYDPAGNIVELVARHTLPSASQHPFRGRSVLGISEIGIATENVPAQVAAIVRRGKTAVYGEVESETFTAVGDEQGLFIVVKRGRIWFPNTGKPAELLPLTIITQIDNKRMTWEFS